MIKYVSTIFFMLMLITVNSLHAEIIYENSFSSPENLKGWTGKTHIADKSLTFSLPKRTKGLYFAKKQLNPATLAGKIIRVRCEAKGSNIMDNNRKSPYHGIKVQMFLKNGTQKNWIDIPFTAKNFNWKKFELVFSVMPKLDVAVLNIGFQSSGGKFQIRNLKIESIGTVVNLASVANMGFEDKIAGDGKGGWTDQGPKQDGRTFIKWLRPKKFFGIPMCVETTGKGILTMKHKQLANGPESVSVPLSLDKAKTLYLMHTLAWAPKMKTEIGSVTITGENGKKKVFSVQSKRDISEWYYSVMAQSNAFPAIIARFPKNIAGAIYISKFSIPRNFGKITGITFKTRENALWLIIGATLTDLDLKLPKRKPYIIKADKQWLPVAGNYRNPIKSGSVLDLSNYMPQEKVGEFGRVIINKDGHFAFEKKPLQPIRFLTCTPINNQDFNDHQSIERLVREMRKSGYNMVRTHFMDAALMKGAKSDLEFNPDMLDHFDYLIYCMKKNGIYLNFDLMTSWLGYSAGNINAKENLNPLKSFKTRIHFEPKIRENWQKGVRKLLCRVNKYTGTRLIDDPILVMAVGYNEQEYGFWRPFSKTHILPAWRKFLKQRYKTIKKLKSSWGKKAEKISAFEEIPCFPLPSRVYENSDVALFLRDVETNTLRWYEKTMRSMGYRGPVVGYNCGKNQYYNMIRKDSPLIMMNAYHAHPSNWIQSGSTISQKSAIEEKSKLFRDFVSVRQAGKPIVVTEYGMVFWNKYRYEQAFVVGAYSAFQGFDALTCYGAPISFRKEKRILSFHNYMDPIAKASEFLTYFLFIRGDIATIPPTLRIRVYEEDVFQKDGLRGGLPADLSLPALVAGLEIECVDKHSNLKQPKSKEIVLKLNNTSSILVSNAGFSQTLDNPKKNAENIIKIFRQKKIIDQSNTSNGRTIFESATGEILMNTAKKFMQINTPRFQGICAEAGTKAKLKNFSVENMTRRGMLSLVSIDGMKTIYEAERLMLVYATNALNSNMKFTRPDMTTLKYVGDMPILLKQGAFKITLNNRNAKNLRLYPLDLTGKRLKELLPVKVEGTRATFHVDTARDGASVFF